MEFFNKINLMQQSGCLIILIVLAACDGSVTPNGTNTDLNEAVSSSGAAAVTDVTFTGESGQYTFSVTIQSPDTGCEQYADWWEVIRSDGTLVYRRILAHSHSDEQPFTRSGGPVIMLAEEEIIVRAHMNNLGYGEQVFRGSVEQGLASATVDSEFAGALETTDPLPNGCAF